LKAANVEAVIHWGDAADSALLLNQMRAMGMKQPFFGGDRTLLHEFTDLAKDLAEGVVCASPWNPDRKDRSWTPSRSVPEEVSARADTYSAHAYDGMNMLIWSVQMAGLNRAKIRDVLAYRSEPWPGVTGDIGFSPVLDDSGEVYLARRENGKWKYYSRAELGLPQVVTPAATTASNGS